MATLETIQDAVNSGKAYAIKQMAINLALLKNGSKAPGIKDITALKRVIRCLQFQINSGVDDADTTTLYNCLLKILAGYNSSYTIDPSVIIPGQTVNVTNVVNFNQDMYPFSGVSTFSLLNYDTTYRLLYGNNPIIQVYLDDQFRDYQTSEDIVRATPGDLTTNIKSITWDFVVNASGYVSIGGTAPAGTGSSSGPGGSIPFIFNQGALVYDGTDWYLPLPLPINRRPVYVESNQVQIVGSVYDRSYTPARLYGFANNESAVIVVNVV